MKEEYYDSTRPYHKDTLVLLQQGKDYHNINDLNNIVVNLLDKGYSMENIDTVPLSTSTNK